MKIWIDSRALISGEGSGSVEAGAGDWLRPGAIYGLQRLKEMNYATAADTAPLTDQQHSILEHEGIRFNEFDREAADLILTVEGELLMLKAPQNGQGAESDAGSSGNRAPASEGVALAGSARPAEGGAEMSSDRAVTSGAETGAGSDSSPIATGSSWTELIHAFLFPRRSTSIERKTGETDISIRLNLDGTGVSEIDTGLKFFDHMLDQIARHGLIDLVIRCKGDLEIDEHHTIEDVAITLGEAIWEISGKDKTGIQRYGFLLPMDESQAEVALDLSNRPYLVWDVSFKREYAGDFPLDMAEHFFHTLAMNLRATLQIRAQGDNDHHKLEAIFKGFAKALRFAVTRTERSRGILPSSKGKL